MGNIFNTQATSKEDGPGQIKVLEKLTAGHPMSDTMIDEILGVPIYDHHLSLTFDEVIVLINKNSTLSETYAQSMAILLTDERRLPVNHPQRCELNAYHPSDYTEFHSHTHPQMMRRLL